MNSSCYTKQALNLKTLFDCITSLEGVRIDSIEYIAKREKGVRASLILDFRVLPTGNTDQIIRVLEEKKGVDRATRKCVY